MQRIVTISLALLLVLALTSPANADEALLRLLQDKDDADKRFAKAEIVFTATLTEVIEGGIAKSDPPVRMYTLQFAGMNVTRGKVPALTKAHYSIHALHAPEFPVGETCTFGACLVGDELLVDLLSPAPRIPTVDRETRIKELEQLIRDRAKPMPR